MCFIKRKSIRYFVIIAAIVIVGIIGYIAYNISQNDGNTIGKSGNGYRIDREPIYSRFPKLGNFEKCYWKSDIIGQNSRVSVPGPTSYWMKGFVILNNKELETFKTEYKWMQIEGNWKPSLLEVDTLLNDLRRELDKY